MKKKACTKCNDSLCVQATFILHPSAIELIYSTYFFHRFPSGTSTTLPSPTPHRFIPTLPQFYFCLSTDTSLRQMPALKPEYEAQAVAVKGRLRGDPSLPLDEEPEEEPPADEDEEV